MSLFKLLQITPFLSFGSSAHLQGRIAKKLLLRRPPPPPPAARTAPLSWRGVVATRKPRNSKSSRSRNDLRADERRQSLSENCAHALITFKNPMSSIYESSVIQSNPGWNKCFNIFVVKTKSRRFTNGSVSFVIRIRRSCKIPPTSSRQSRRNKVCKQ